MQTSVNLQPPFSYSIYPIILICLCIILFTIYLLIKRNKQKKRVEDKIKVEEIKNVDINEIKRKYLEELDVIESQLNTNMIHIRIAYQDISRVIRHFVYKVTNIHVQNYSLKEIKDLDMPMLYELMQEYYVPEFSKYSYGNVKDSLQKTRKVIEKWN